MKPPSLVIRADAGPSIGAGHLMRCLALAQAWRRTGERVAFLSNQRVPDADFESSPLTAESGSPADACATAQFSAEADWVVLDGYHFDADFQSALKHAGRRVLIIDDHGHAGRYCADLVLDQNVTATTRRYAQREPGTRLLLGSRFALLREEFLACHGWKRLIAPCATRVLVTFGAADPTQSTRRVLDAISDLPGLEIVAVAGPHAHLDLPSRTNVRLERAVADMSALMRDCDIAITAAGSTCWELAFLQTPMLVIPVADNQHPIAAALDTQGIAVNLGWHADVTATQLATATETLLADEQRRRTMAAAGRALIDGEGAARVVVHMKKALISLRPATGDDCRRVWEWSNEPAVREASFRSEPIPWERHQHWFAARMGDPATKFYIAEKEAPVGQTRFALSENDEATISVSLDAAQRGRGLGSAVILAACERLFAETPVNRVRAFIKPHNEGSLHAFARAGFDRVQDVRIEDQAAAQFVLERDAA